MGPFVNQSVVKSQEAARNDFMRFACDDYIRVD